MNRINHLKPDDDYDERFWGRTAISQIQLRLSVWLRTSSFLSTVYMVCVCMCVRRGCLRGVNVLFIIFLPSVLSDVMTVNQSRKWARRIPGVTVDNGT